MLQGAPGASLSISAAAITFPAVAGLVVAGFRALSGAFIGPQTAI
jgi:hypothetical protein